MDQESLEGLQEEFSNAVCDALRSAVRRAIELLRSDIRDCALTGENSHPDTFMIRANQLGLALFNCGAYAVAERLYRMMAELTESYRDETGNSRHAGAIYANTAAACAVQGNMDEAVVQLFRAAQDDVTTYPISELADSYAVKTILPQYFSQPALEDALNVLQTVDAAATMSDLHGLTKDLGDLQYAFLAYVRIAVLHEKTNRESPNLFSQLQLFSALRSLSSLLEVHLKTLAGTMEATFHPTVQSLYDSERWWRAWEQTRKNIGATMNSTSPVDDRLRDSLALAPANDASKFWKGLLVAYIVRNYTVHQFETRCDLVRLYAVQALAHILHVFVAASKYT